jgi:hypothetical protein
VYVRVVRFADVDPERLAALVAQVEESEGPPPGVEAKGFTMLHDEEQRTAVVLQYFETAETMEAGGKAFAAMPAGDTPGTRASVDACEVKLELKM